MAFSPFAPIRRTLLAALAGLMLVASGASHAASMRIANQQALSRAIGEFRPSRYVQFKGCDAQDCHFQEAGKFGPLGPSDKFHIARQVIDFDGAPMDGVAVYEHNRGQFRVGHPPQAKVIAANFKEPFTKEEERYVKAVEHLQHLPAHDTGKMRRDAWHSAMHAAYNAQHPTEAASYAHLFLDDIADRAKEIVFADDVHIAHTILGLVALQQGEKKQAIAQLLASADVADSPTLSSFGPNMRLAEALLQAGEPDAVLAYLRRCQQFWNRPAAATWISDVAAGRAPSFGANLDYGIR